MKQDALALLPCCVPGTPESSPCAADRRGPAAHAPLLGLAGSELAQRFRWWRGGSGQRYMFSVFRLLPERLQQSSSSEAWRADGDLALLARFEHCPRYDAAILLAVACDGQGDRRILHMADTGAFPDLVFGGEPLLQALRQGANEIHVHLLAEDAADRQAILRDLDGHG